MRENLKLYVNTRKLYKVWFSNNHEIFLNDLNKLRLIAFRSNNPEASISLIYSSTLLSPAAIREMGTFLNPLNITAIDVIDIKPRLRYAEKKLFELVEDELNKWKEGKCGNFASASDIIRLLPFVATNYGTYTDFDVELNASSLPEMVEVGEYGLITPHTNNDLVAFTRYEDDSLSDEAERAMGCLHSQLTRNYRKALYKEALIIDSHLSIWNMSMLTEIRVKQGLEDSIFGFRQMLEKLTIGDVVGNIARQPLSDYLTYLRLDTNKIQEAIKSNNENELFNISGDIILQYLSSMAARRDAGTREGVERMICKIKEIGLGEYAKVEFTHLKNQAIVQSVSAMSGPLMMKEALGGTEKLRGDASNIEQLKSLCHSTNSTSYVREKYKGMDYVDILMRCKEDVGAFGDLSFTRRGMEKLEDRDKATARSITTIQAYVRGYLTRRAHSKKHVELDNTHTLRT